MSALVDLPGVGPAGTASEPRDGSPGRYEGTNLTQGNGTHGHLCQHAIGIRKTQPEHASREVLSIAIHELAGELGLAYSSQSCDHNRRQVAGFQDVGHPSKFCLASDKRIVASKG